DMFRLRLLAGLTKLARPLVLAATCLIGMVATLTGAGTDIDNGLRAERYEHFRKAPSGELVLVTIDTSSIKALGAWPWPRTRHGDLVKALDEAGASKIVFDIIFDQPAANPDED